MNCFFSLRPAFILLVAVVALALPDQASAQERPHFSRGTAQFVSPNDFVAPGTQRTWATTAKSGT